MLSIAASSAACGKDPVPLDAPVDDDAAQPDETGGAGGGGYECEEPPECYYNLESFYCQDGDVWKSSDGDHCVCTSQSLHEKCLDGCAEEGESAMCLSNGGGAGESGAEQ